MLTSIMRTHINMYPCHGTHDVHLHDFLGCKQDNSRFLGVLGHIHIYI